MIERVPITDVSPVVERGRYAVKAVVGESLQIAATVFREGHEALGAGAVLKGPRGRSRPLTRLEPTDEPDRYAAWVTPDKPGAWTFRIESWADPYASWRHSAEIKIEAEIDVELMLAEGVLVLRRAADATPAKSGARRRLEAAVTAASDTDRSVSVRLGALTSTGVDAALADYPLRDMLSATDPFPLYVDRERALVGSWYEFFPRSEGASYDEQTDTWTSGTFATAARRLDAVAAMGFDVVYLPPIHPIGAVNRKGPNNTLTPGPSDPGSPWAIGSRLGGHDAIHPDLGTIDDFDAFVARAGELGMEVALDLALQCAPDHPWVASHPEWFTTRADGTIAYAENPPKKYQDIYPLNFDNDYQGVSREVLRVVRHWMDHGVRIFRVDNPHTKPVMFWEWLLGKVRASDPDVLFLSEAFTKPAMMRALAMVGFHQSYTYFTWRNTKFELASYLAELSHEQSDVMRPNLFVNTPDILSDYLQYGGPAAFAVRAVLAATGSPTWGVYAGYELFEHVAIRPGSEEYLNSEKFQLRPRDWERAAAEKRTLAPYLASLNDIRRRHPALQRLRNITLHATEDDAVLCYSKRGDSEHGDDVVIVVVNLDPHGGRETVVHLSMPALGYEWYDTFLVDDEMTGQTWRWGERNYVRLDPSEPAHLLSVRRKSS
ncbi:MAG: alpha-1,4-glucan--maltose-1-phosphate maltosyltransferase [Nocardioidaceae bacterium]